VYKDLFKHLTIYNKMEDKPLEITENREIDRMLHDLPSAKTAMDITIQSKTFWDAESAKSPQITDAKRIIKRTILDGCLESKTFCEIKISDFFAKDIIDWLKVSGYVTIRKHADRLGKIPAHWYLISWEQTDF
jgi:hypothetical protein